MDLLSTAKRKDALPDPAKINPPHFSTAVHTSEVAQKARAKNVNKTDVAEAVRREVDLPSLSIKGQATSGAVVSAPPFHCSVAQVADVSSFWKTAQAKGSDIASDTSILQFSEPAQHNPDDVMSSIPADYDYPALVELLHLVRRAIQVKFTWRPWEVLSPPMRWRCRDDPFRVVLILHRLAGHQVG
jgi:hypothetical protein